MPYTIKGVELLSTQYDYRPTLLSFIIAILLSVLCIYCVKYVFDNKICTFITELISFLASLIFLLLCTEPELPLAHNQYLSHHYHTEYKVTISDEVPLQTLLSHYKIVSQDGKIYTLKEKTHDK